MITLLKPREKSLFCEDGKLIKTRVTGLSQLPWTSKIYIPGFLQKTDGLEVYNDLIKQPFLVNFNFFFLKENDWKICTDVDILLSYFYCVKLNKPLEKVLLKEEEGEYFRKREKTRKRDSKLRQSLSFLSIQQFTRRINQANKMEDYDY